MRDDEFRQNVGRIEKNFSGWGRISCPGYVTLREILRRNQMADDGSYCLLWDKANVDTRMTAFSVYAGYRVIENDKGWLDVLLGGRAALVEANGRLGLALSDDDANRDRVLTDLYDGARRGGLGGSQPKVARWLGDIRQYFPASVVQVSEATQRISTLEWWANPPARSASATDR